MSSGNMRPAIIFKALEGHLEGLDTRELASICLRHRDLDDGDQVLRRSMAMKIANMVDKLRVKSSTEKVGQGYGAFRRLALSASIAFRI